MSDGAMTKVALVPTPRAARYAKQLSSHLGRRSQVRELPEGILLVLPVGSCLMASDESALTLTAEAPTAEDLDTVTGVVGRHLVRFGERDELVVDWQIA